MPEPHRFRVNAELNAGDYLMTVLPDGGYRFWGVEWVGVDLDATFRRLNGEAEENMRAAIAEEDA